MRGYYHTGCPSIAPTASPIFFISQPALDLPTFEKGHLGLAPVVLRIVFRCLITLKRFQLSPALSNGNTTGDGKEIMTHRFRVCARIANANGTCRHS
jgi:hypothetical protein